MLQINQITSVYPLSDELNAVVQPGNISCPVVGRRKVRVQLYTMYTNIGQERRLYFRRQGWSRCHGRGVLRRGCWGCS